MNKSVESMACKSFEETIELANRIKEQQQEIERLNNIIDKAKEKSIALQKRYGYILDDLIYLLMQGSDKK